MGTASAPAAAPVARPTRRARALRLRGAVIPAPAHAAARAAARRCPRPRGAGPPSRTGRCGCATRRSAGPSPGRPRAERRAARPWPRSGRAGRPGRRTGLTAGRRRRPGVRRRRHPDRHLLAVAHLPREVHPARSAPGSGPPPASSTSATRDPGGDAHQPRPPHLPGDGDDEASRGRPRSRPTARRQPSSSRAPAGPPPAPPAAPPARPRPPPPPRRRPPPAPARAPPAGRGRSGRRARPRQPPVGDRRAGRRADRCRDRLTPGSAPSAVVGAADAGTPDRSGRDTSTAASRPDPGSGSGVPCRRR